MELNNTHAHIILYAKGHYPTSKDVIKDLKMVSGYFFWMEPKYISQTDLLQVIADIYQETHLKHYPHLGLPEMFRNIFNFKRDDKASIVELINGMLSGIRHVEVKYLPTPFPTKDEALIKIMELGSEELTTFHNYR